MKIKEIVAAIPMVDVARAVEFYKNILELRVETLSANMDMYWVTSGESKFLLYKKGEASKAEHTAMSFTVENIKESVLKLEENGVKFYQSNNTKIFDLDGSLSAWFQDSEGNNLEISQRP
ncbi:MAG: VOC family protein [Bacteroidota bacterium]